MPVLNAFKITTFSHLEHRSNITEYSLYNCIRYRNAKTRQSVAYVATSKLSARMPIVLPMYK